MTIEVLSDLLREFEWPAPYELEDWLPDGIAVVFPKCQLFFSEGFESHLSLKFLAESPGLGETVDLHALMVSLGGLHTPGLDKTHLPQASLEKVQIGVRNLCKPPDGRGLRLTRPPLHSRGRHATSTIPFRSASPRTSLLRLNPSTARCPHMPIVSSDFAALGRLNPLLGRPQHAEVAGQPDHQVGHAPEAARTGRSSSWPTRWFASRFTTRSPPIPFGGGSPRQISTRGRGRCGASDDGPTVFYVDNAGTCCGSRSRRMTACPRSCRRWLRVCATPRRRRAHPSRVRSRRRLRRTARRVGQRGLRGNRPISDVATR